MTLARLLMMCGLLLLPIGLIYGMSMHGDPRAMSVELTCLALGAGLFRGGLLVDRKRSG